jgi:hypothetical protein
MQGRIQTLETEIGNNQTVSSTRKLDSSPVDLIQINRISEILNSEGNESFRHYIDWLGMSCDSRLLVLSSIHHYYYDAEEMVNLKTVVNLKELNHVKDINSFLHSMFLILPPKCFLIGCFIDNKKQSGFSLKRRFSQYGSKTLTEEEKNGIESGIPFLNTIFSFLDAKTNKYLSSKNVTRLLINNGFNTMDMTELEGLTYFCAQRQHPEDN